MCTVSNVVDSYRDDYNRKWKQDQAWPSTTPQPYFPPTFQPMTSKEKQELEELRAFKKTVDAAKELDKITGAPDCEEPERKKILTEILDRLAELERKMDQLI